jgi:gamma-glutamyltranspeptidase/glutathione hydrolase
MAGMIVAPQPLAVEEGAAVLRQGGNAIDAVIAAALVQGVIDPLSCGLGGFGMMVVYMAGRRDTVCLDFNGRAGSKATADMWQRAIERPAIGDAGYVLKGKVNDIGYQSIGVPSTVMGLRESWRRFGSWPWEDLFQPAIAHARLGYAIPAELARKWRNSDFAGRSNSLERFTATPAAARTFTQDGKLLAAGDLLVNPDLADTLEIVAREGPAAFYHGRLAETMAHDLEAHDALLTGADLAACRIVVTEPLRATYRNYEIVTSPAPGGGLTVVQILKILEGYDLRALAHNDASYIHLLAMAMKAAFADRNRFVGDPLFVAVPEAKLRSEAHARQWRETIEHGDAFDVGFPRSWESADTTHISAIDGAGNCVSLTHTLGVCSGVMTPGLGFMYNETMRLFDPIPGGPNSIAPGKARVTGMAPTIIFKDGRPFLILGAPGGNRIMSAVSQTILNVIDHRMTLLEAVVAPRIDCQGDFIDVEGRIPRSTCHELEQRGHHIVRDPASYGSFPARVHAILVDPDRGLLVGAADPRDYGMALSAS